MIMTVRVSSGSGRVDARTTGNSVRVPTSSRCIATSIVPDGTPAFLQAFLSPVGTVPNKPIEQRLLEADIGSGFLALDPLVFQNFFALRQEFFVKNGVLNELRLIF